MTISLAGECCTNKGKYFHDIIIAKNGVVGCKYLVNEYKTIAQESEFKCWRAILLKYIF